MINRYLSLENPILIRFKGMNYARPKIHLRIPPELCENNMLQLKVIIIIINTLLKFPNIVVHLHPLL